MMIIKEEKDQQQWELKDKLWERERENDVEWLKKEGSFHPCNRQRFLDFIIFTTCIDMEMWGTGEIIS